MRHSVVVKFIAFLLAAFSVAAVAGGAVGIALSAELDMYTMSFDEWYAQRLEDRVDRLARKVAEQYAAETHSNCSDAVLEFVYQLETQKDLSAWFGLEQGSWHYEIAAENGAVLTSGGSTAASDHRYSLSVVAEYPVISSAAESWDRYITVGGQDYYLRYVPGPIYTVTVTLAANAFSNYNGIPMTFIQTFHSLRYTYIAILAAGLLVFAISIVYLCCAAGKTSRTSEVCPGGLNRLPLDLYGVLTGIGCFLLVALAWAIFENWFLYASYNIGVAALSGIILLVAAVWAIGFLYAVAAQFKAKNRYWWHHSVVGWCCGKLLRGGHFLFRAVCSLAAMLPLTGQGILIGAGMGFFPLLFFYLAAVGRSYWIVFLVCAVLCDIAIICYGAYAFGTLLKGADRMAQGNLNSKISTRYLFGTFARCAENLNELADVATVAAKNQMRSERMKTELITNVSHDIKTPLTSIINYVDLLEKANTEAERTQYLEVLGRQSQRLKKLIEDLMDMSKATTGNIAVDITQVDAGETVNQALGEFADKLAASQLTPVFRQPDQMVVMQADGRLTWRVLSNLLSNIVKYALPGTRVYIDLMQLEDRVMLSLKNISREPLNVSADELTERFVRGDISRNTEGSGLGLNIAKSLMELQKGQLQLLVDGDLFKVTLTFPAQ